MVDGLTQILAAVRAGEPGAEERLFELVYDELHRLAASRRAQFPDDSLSTTDILHGTYVRLAEAQEDWSHSRAHFFVAFGEAMRRLQIEYHRKKRAQKRGGGERPIALGTLPLAAMDVPAMQKDVDSETVLSIDEELSRMAADGAHARSVAVLVQRYFGGLLEAEIAEALSISVATVKRDLVFMRQELNKRLS